MAASKYTLNLSQADGVDVSKVGGKAANLGALTSMGFPVPEGYIITTDGYNRFIQANQMEDFLVKTIASIDFSNPSSIEACSKRIRSMFEAPLPDDLLKEITSNYHSLDCAVAVRSSATSEDLPDASFAGQMESSLNVLTTEELAQKVKSAYASLWSSRAISYRQKNGIPQSTSKMAVVVQRLAPSRSAGVLFTANPVTYEGSELVIESNWGLGESVVSGRVSPDKFTVRLVRSGGLEIVTREIGAKEQLAEAAGSGVEYRDSGEKGISASLNDEEVIKLCEMGKRIEAAFNSPQDIEWAIGPSGNISILQSRPITVLRSGVDEGIVWSRGYSDDYWNDNVSPLFFELLGDHLTKIVNMELNEIMGYRSLDTEETKQLLRLHKAHAYFNLEVLKRKVENEIPPFLRNDDVLNYFPEGEGPYGKETMRRLPFNLFGRVWAEIMISMKDPKGKGDVTDRAYYSWTEEVFDPYWNSFRDRITGLETRPLRDYMALADEVDELMQGHFRLVRYGIPVHNIGMNLLTQYLLSRFIGAEEGARAYPVLVSGLKHKTSETNECINKLALMVRASDELRKLVAEKPSKELYEMVSFSPSEDVARFKNHLDSFLREFGSRGFTREPLYPRWYEEPAYIFDILKSLSSGNIIDHEAAGERSEKLRFETEQKVRAIIASQMIGSAKWKLLSGILRSARRYIIFREQQRFNLDRWITMCRRVYLDIGSSFTKAGMIKEPSDIFFLTKSEIRSLASGLLVGPALEDLRVKLDRRLEEYKMYEDKTPPKFLQGDREFNDPPPSEASYLKGIPASQGVLTAPVRVLSSIDEIWRVQAGEVLVVPRTDPGWTPVFSKIGGLITETGGVLSHGAVVSREYGIPAVTNIHNACRIFQTGQTVTIDGVKGVVIIEQGN